MLFLLFICYKSYYFAILLFCFLVIIITNHTILLCFVVFVLFFFLFFFVVVVFVVVFVCFVLFCFLFFFGWFVCNGLVSVLCYHPYYFSSLIIPTLESIFSFMLCTKFNVILLFVHSPIITSSSSILLFCYFNFSL